MLIVYFVVWETVCAVTVTDIITLLDAVLLPCNFCAALCVPII